MPELPEVETTVRGVRPFLLHKILKRVVVNTHKLRWVLDIPALQRLTGHKITAVERRAKYIWLTFKNGQNLCLHLGMSGRLCHFPADYIPQKHDHLLLYTSAGSVIVLHDPRKFGEATIVSPNAPRFAKLGLEPLGDDLTSVALQQVMQTGQPIKSALLDQNRIAGLGNIYVCEALFTARIHPERPAKSLTLPEAKRLVPAIKQVLNASIDAGGSSLRDYVHTTGELGWFQKQFKVYGRTGEPCVKCGQPIHQIRQAGRSTFFCAKCQK